MIKELDDYKLINSFSDYNVTKNEFNHIRGIYVDNILIGFIDFSIMYERAELNYIFIIDDYRRMGYSSKLMKYMIDKCKSLDVKSITLEVKINNLNAINLYKKFDFKQIGIRDKYYNGIDALLMEMKVGE